jgi:glycosyltransferase involved in cell wall biosynthesis
MDRRRRLRALYLCYLSLDDPLVQTQVVAYLRGLASAGHHIHLLTFETARLTRERRRALRRALATEGIRWHGLRYHKRPSLPATALDALAGAAYAALLVRRHGLDTLHARAHVPAAMALIARRTIRTRPALIFDIRGLMAEEYEDAGRWRRNGIPFRLTKAVERAAIRESEGIVVLTERIRGQLFGGEPARHVRVIPCCADLERLAAATPQRERIRAELGVSGATVMIYVGKFGGWYMAREMAEFFAVARGSIGSLHFLILTQGDREEIRREMDRRAAGDTYTIDSVTPDRIAGYLAAADFGISLIRPVPSKVASSPTKVGEYLGAGLPVVSTARVGDLDTLITPDVGAIISDCTTASYQQATAHVARLLTRADTPDHCRAVARRELSLEAVGIKRYSELYEDVAARAPNRE